MLELLTNALKQHSRRYVPALAGRTNHLVAGVVVLLEERADELFVIATLRPASMRSHAGEVCFPGGMPEDGDRDLWATACRETREEIGVTDVRQLGRLSSIPLYTSNHRIEPFVAVAQAPLDDAGGLVCTPNPAEVDRVYRLRLRELIGRAWLGIPYTLGGKTTLYPYLEMAEFDPADRGAIMYGATAIALWELLEIAAAATNQPVPEVSRGPLGWAQLIGG